MTEQMPIDNLGTFVAAQHHPMAPDGQVAILAVDKLARQLAAYRESSGLTQREIAANTGWSQTKVLRIENGLARPSATDVLAILSICGVTDEATKASLRSQALANRTQRKPHPYSRLLSPAHARYLEYEPAAKDGICVYGLVTVPDFLQTSAYAAQLDQVFRPSENLVTTTALAQLRRERAAKLLGAYGPPLRIILCEEALWRLDSAASVVFRGLQRLNAANRQLPEDAQLNPNIAIQVAPFSVGARAVSIGSCACNILHMPGNPPAVYPHGPNEGDFTHDDPDKAGEYQRRFDELAAHIPGPDETNDFLDATLANLLAK